MKKKSLFLSAGLTTFILVLVAGVIKVSADSLRYSADHPVASVAVATQAQPTDTLQQPTDTSQPTISHYISPEEAIAIASIRLGSKDVYSIDTTSLAGMDVYKVSFSSGNVVYVSPEGHILAVTSLTRVVQENSSGPGSNSQPSSSMTGGNPTSVPPSHTDDHGGDSGGDD
jgi:hypothetical protein